MMTFQTAPVFPIKITDTAISHSKKILANYEKPAAIRVTATEGGCAGLMYSFDIAKTPEEGDTVINGQDTYFVFDNFTSFRFQEMGGVTIDFVTTPMSSKFMIIGGEKSQTCGCGLSVG